MPATETPQRRLGPNREPGLPSRPDRHLSGALLFLVAATGYAAFGMWLSMKYNVVDGDGPSRVANAGFVLFSRDPHLGAIGFVWNPLPSLVELPLLELRGLWPPMQTQGQAGTIQSALFMGGAVVMVRAIARDRGLPMPARWVVVAVFALNPMIVVLAGNGMSEAALVFCCVWATRHLMLWVDRGDLQHLIAAGVALGFGYAARYEALAAAMSAGALVALVTAWSGRSDLRRGLREAAHDVTLLMFPVGLSVGVWAVTGWLLTGHLFAQFSSQYGNSSQLHTAGAATLVAATPGANAILRDIVSLAPMLPTVLVIALALALRRRASAVLAPIAILGGVLAFEALAQLKGLTFGWFRFYLCAVPLCAIAVTTLWGPCGAPPRLRRTGPVATLQRLACTRIGSAFAAAAVSVVVLAPSLPSTWSAMINPAISQQFGELGVRYVLTSDRSKADAQAELDAFEDDRAVARWLDDQHLPRASVLTDTYQGWPIWLASRNSGQFVVTSDYDFYKDLNAPGSTGIRYVLVSNPSFDAAVDAVNRRYPTLWDNGSGIAVREMDVQKRGGDTSWRIYRVIPIPPSAGDADGST